MILYVKKVNMMIKTKGYLKYLYFSKIIKVICIFYFIIFNSIINSALADTDKILPIKYIEICKNVGLYANTGEGEIQQIYNLRFDNDFESNLDMYYRHYRGFSDPTIIEWDELAPYHIIFDSVDDNVIETVIISYDELDKLLFSEYRWDNSIVLEDNSNTIGKLFIDYKKIDYSSKNLIISPDKKKVGGVIFYVVYRYDGHFVHHFYFNQPRLWDAAEGYVLFKTEYAEDLLKACVIETRFSPDSRYFYVRYPKTFNIDLIETATLTTIPAQGDVAYNSDVHYMVTGRNGLPTLVDLTTMEEIHKYEIAGAMTACAFSPDDKELYIVDANRTLYIFDSKLPTLVVDWEIFE